jgi:hypothetical protein
MQLNATIRWDSDGCISNVSQVSYHGGSQWTRIQARFTDMIMSDYTWSVMLGTPEHTNPLGCGYEEHCSWMDTNTRTAYIFYDDMDTYTDGERVHRGAPYHRCGFARLFRRGYYDRAGLILHEMWGHGTFAGTAYASHTFRALWIFENAYNRAYGRPEACHSK